MQIKASLRISLLFKYQKEKVFRPNKDTNLIVFKIEFQIMMMRYLYREMCWHLPREMRHLHREMRMHPKNLGYVTPLIQNDFHQLSINKRSTV